MIIPKMYDVELTSSNYNPDISTSITITATATDYNGNPVIGESLTIKHNGIAVGNAVTTNANGQASVVTTCGSGGTHQFSCKSASCIITVNPYPIGSIYISTNSTDPSTLFGGTWTQIEDRFLLASGSTYTNGDTGGEASVTLTANQSGVPVHQHGMAHNHNHHHTAIGYTNTSGSGSNRRNPVGYTSSGAAGTLSTDYDNTASSKSVTDNNTAQDASEAHNNMPPYLVVSVWERTA